MLDRVLGSRDLFDAPLLVLANKKDVLDSWSTAEIQEHLGIGELDSRPTRVMPISAIKGEGISDSIRWLLTETLKSSRATRLRQRASRN